MLDDYVAVVGEQLVAWGTDNITKYRKKQGLYQIFCKKITPQDCDVYRIYIVAVMALLFDDAFNRTEEEMHSFGFVTVLSG